MSAVVVPSPATSLVLKATSLTSWAAWFSKMLPRSISCAMVTPSLVKVGEIRGLCNTTYWPLGPSVVLTASASLFTPASIDRRASVSNLSFLCATNPPFGRSWSAFQHFSLSARAVWGESRRIEKRHEPVEQCVSRRRRSPVGVEAEVLKCYLRRCALRNQDSSSPELAVVEVLYRVVYGVERIGRGVQVDLALGGEHHQFDEVVVGADQVAGDIALGRDDVALLQQQ